jgi:uncharacterized membrane protein YidH (DUF202 family)
LQCIIVYIERLRVTRSPISANVFGALLAAFTALSLNAIVVANLVIDLTEECAWLSKLTIWLKAAQLAFIFIGISVMTFEVSLLWADVMGRHGGRLKNREVLGTGVVIGLGGSSAAREWYRHLPGMTWLRRHATPARLVTIFIISSILIVCIVLIFLLADATDFDEAAVAAYCVE